MHLEKINLVNYKNFDAKAFEFHPKINCLIGLNGVGKTNVLDAIYHLCLGKSYFNPINLQNINHDADFFMIEGVFNKDEQRDKILVSLKKGHKKTIKKNNKEYEKVSEHIGQFPLVIISPADRDLIIEGSETRRKFIDGVIAQNDTAYLNTLIKYQKLLAQRNALLKYFAANGTFNKDALLVYDEAMIPLSYAIYKKRKAVVADLKVKLIEHYRRFVDRDELVDIAYESDLAKVSENEFSYDIAQDRQYRYTASGIHKDDLVFLLNDFPLKKYGSQGQQKSFLIALKMAQYSFSKSSSGLTPILLLDDIFDKLDEQRVAKLIDLVEDNEVFGQLFITDTHEDRTRKIISATHQEYQIFSL